MDIEGKIYNHSKTRKPKPKPRYRSNRDYDFLQYIRIVMKWAVENSGLRKSEVELLLYLYPKGVFTKYDFARIHRTMGIYQIKTLKRMRKEGWINLWRRSSKGIPSLYCLTQKGKTLCNKMHKYCTGDLKITTNPTYNKLARKDDSPRIYNYYMHVIKEMNKGREEDS